MTNTEHPGTEYITAQQGVNTNISHLKLNILMLNSYNTFHAKRMMAPNDHSGVRLLVGEICWIVENWTKLNAAYNRAQAAREKHQLGTQMQTSVDLAGS